VRNAVDLIVMTSVRQGQNIKQECVEPGRLLGQMDLTGFEARALGFRTSLFDANGHGSASLRMRSELLDKASRRRDLKQSHSMRKKRRPTAVIRRPCSDSLMTASQMDQVFGSDTFHSRPFIDD
jgi:hypothetical protein